MLQQHGNISEKCSDDFQKSNEGMQQLSSSNSTHQFVSKDCNYLNKGSQQHISSSSQTSDNSQKLFDESEKASSPVSPSGHNIVPQGTSNLDRSSLNPVSVCGQESKNLKCFKISSVSEVLSDTSSYREEIAQLEKGDVYIPSTHLDVSGITKKKEEKTESCVPAITVPHTDKILQKMVSTEQSSFFKVVSDTSSSSKETIEFEKRDDKTLPHIALLHNDVCEIQHKAEKTMEKCIPLTPSSQSDQIPQAVIDAQQNFYSDIVTDISWSPRETIELEKEDLKASTSSTSELDLPQSYKISSNFNDSESSTDVEKQQSASNFCEMQTKCIQTEKSLEENERVSGISNVLEAPTALCTTQSFENNIQKKELIFSSPDSQEMSLISNFSVEPTRGLQAQKKIEDKYITEINYSVALSMPQPVENKDENKEFAAEAEVTLGSPLQLEGVNQTVSANMPRWYNEIVLFPETEREGTDFVTDPFKQEKLLSQTNCSSAKICNEIKEFSSPMLSSTASPVSFENKETTKVVTPLQTHRGKLSPKVHQTFFAMSVQSCSDNVPNLNATHQQNIGESDTSTQTIPRINMCLDTQSTISFSDHLQQMPRALTGHKKVNKTCQPTLESSEMEKNSSCESLVDHVVPQQNCNLIKNNEQESVQQAPIQCSDSGIENDRIADPEENTLSSQTLQSSYGFVVSAKSPELAQSPECTFQPFAWEDWPDRPITVRQVSSASTLESTSNVSQLKQHSEECDRSTNELRSYTDVTSNFMLRNTREEKYSVENSSPNYVQEDSKVCLDYQLESDILQKSADRTHNVSAPKAELTSGNNKKRKLDIMDGTCEEHVVPGDENDMYNQQLTQEISLYTTSVNIQRISTGTTEHSCESQKPSFKWSSSYGSCLNDPGPEFDKAETSVREILPNVIRISNCTRPRRVGLSKKHSVKHLHNK